MAILNAPVRRLHGWMMPLDGWMQAIFLLALRLILADIFLRAGLLKLQAWDSTLMLFEYEYAVPWLSPTLAAWLGTAGEIVFPSLLVLGFGGRFAALGLLALNLVAAISYPDISAAGIKDHVLWGWFCAMLAVFGCGRFSFDGWMVASWRGHAVSPQAQAAY
ncbi:MAG: DoxX family protein [Gammaproteobacteria bacterium]|nr:DoxX family protein [Gammaproteobacteria bacterium]